MHGLKNAARETVIDQTENVDNVELETLTDSEIYKMASGT